MLYEKLKRTEFFKNSKSNFALILAEDGMNISQLSRLSGITLAHLYSIINQWERAGLITTEKVNQRRFITLTKKGKTAQTGLKLFMEAVVD